MPLSQQDAADALHVLETAERRSVVLRDYAGFAPYLILWGILWGVGYGASWFRPDWSNIVWLAIIVIGTSVGMWLNRDREAGTEAASLDRLKLAALFVTIFVFIGATIAVMQPQDPRQVGAFIPLVVACIYAGIGVMWAAPRLTVAGA